MAVAAVAAVLGALGGGTIVELANKKSNIELKAAVRALIDENDSLREDLIKEHLGFEKLRVQFVGMKSKDILDELKGKKESDIGDLTYAYMMKEYFQLQIKVLFKDGDLAEDEAVFLEISDLIHKGRLPEDEIGMKQRSYVKEYILRKYEADIDALKYPDLDKLLDELNEEIKKENKKNHKDTKKTGDAEKGTTNQFESLKAFSLTKYQTVILYSIEYLKIAQDIEKTKDATKQYLKRQWLRTWESTIKQQYGVGLRLKRTEPEIKAAIDAERDSNNSSAWFYIIFFEAALFEPYQPLSKDEYENKVYEKIHLERGSKTVEKLYKAVCKPGEEKALKGIIDEYRKSYDILSGARTAKTISLLATVILSAVSFGTAYAFAPGIAVALAGPGFAGLHGIALTNASLAFFGGGALATGGLGVAGGTFSIAGGGALLGMLGGGTASNITGNIVFSVPNIVAVEMAKLIATEKKIIVEKAHDHTIVSELIVELHQRIDDLIENIRIIESSENVDKKAVKNMRKSLDVMTKAMKML